MSTEHFVIIILAVLVLALTGLAFYMVRAWQRWLLILLAGMKATSAADFKMALQQPAKHRAKPEDPDKPKPLTPQMELG